MHGTVSDSQRTSPAVGLNTEEEGEGANSITPTQSYRSGIEK